MNRVRDEQGVVLNWLLRLVLTVAVLGVILFDAGSIAWNYFGVDSSADDIAFKVSESLANGTQVFTTLEEEARLLAKDRGARLVDFQITQEEIVVKIKREASTIVVSRLDAISDWGKAEATGSSPNS